jgi:hypothetical protein
MVVHVMSEGDRYMLKEHIMTIRNKVSEI